MAKQLLVQNLFGGGIAESEKTGIKGSFYFAQNLDIYSDVGQIKLNPKTIKDSGSTVTNLIKWIAPATPYDTNIYFYDAAGNIYKRTSGGSWSVDRSGATIGNGAAGQGMEMYNDYLYYATSTTIGRKGLLDGSPSFNDDFLSDAVNNLDQSATTSSQTYTLPTSISEAATALKTFTPTVDPIKEIDVLLAAKGTGNWTLTLHDAANNVIGTATVANGSLVSGGSYQPFIFSTPLRILTGHAYHFHLTSTVADGTVTTGVASDLSTVSYREYFGILIADTNFHPILTFGAKICIGNERYLAVWDEATYSANKLVFPPGFKVRALALVDEYIAISVWRGSAIYSSEESYVFLWDGSATTYNYDIKSDEGAIGAMCNSQNRLCSVVGSSGALFMDYAPFQQVGSLIKTRKLAFNNYVEIYPGAITNWKNQILFGVAAATDSTTLVEGVYQLDGEPNNDIMNMGYTISTGNTQNVSIGAVRGIGNQLFIAWKDTNSGTVYGVDQVLQTNNPFATGSMEFLIFDNGVPMMEKLADIIKVAHLPLNSGESVTPGYRIDRAASYTLGDITNQAVNDTNTSQPVPVADTRFHEFQFEVVLGAGTTTPTVTGISLKYDDLIPETATKGKK